MSVAPLSSRPCTILYFALIYYFLDYFIPMREKVVKTEQWFIVTVGLLLKFMDLTLFLTGLNFALSSLALSQDHNVLFEKTGILLYDRPYII